MFGFNLESETEKRAQEVIKNMDDHSLNVAELPLLPGSSFLIVRTGTKDAEAHKNNGLVLGVIASPSGEQFLIFIAYDNPVNK